MRSILLVTAALLIAAAPAAEAADTERHRRRGPGVGLEDHSRRRPAGDRSCQWRPRGDPARSRLRARPRRQHQGPVTGRILEGASVYRLQDNYVAQWGLNDSGKPWPAGVTPKPPAEYTRPLKGLQITPLGSPIPMRPRRASPTAGRSLIRHAPVGRTSPIAMRASASAATSRPTPGRAASSTR